MASIVAIIATVFKSISIGDEDSLNYYLSLLPIKDIAAERSNALLHSFLLKCGEYNQYDMVKHIFNAWREVYPYQIEINDELYEYSDQPSLMTILFYTPIFTLPSLVAAARGSPNYFAVRILFELSVYPDSDEVVAAARKVIQVYGQPQKEQLDIILERCSLNNANRLYNYINTFFNKVSDYAPIPKWLGNFYLGDGQISDQTETNTGNKIPLTDPISKEELPLETDLLIPRDCQAYDPDDPDISGLPQLTADQVADLLLEPVRAEKLQQSTNMKEFLLAELKQYGPDQLKQIGVEQKLLIDDSKNSDVPDVNILAQLLLPQLYDPDVINMVIDREREKLKLKYRISTQQQKAEILGPILQDQALANLQSDIKLYRLLGPANPFMDADTEELEYGGERMFLSVKYEQADDDDRQVLDWFTGSCLVCSRQIRKRYHAVRRPIVSGGWSECFCTWQCVRIRLTQLAELYSLPEEVSEASENYTLAKSMVDYYEQQILQIGIQDRIIIGNGNE